MCFTRLTLSLANDSASHVGFHVLAEQGEKSHSERVILHIFVQKAVSERIYLSLEASRVKTYIRDM